MAKAKTKLDRLIAQTFALAEQFPVMPIEEIRLSVALAELPNPEQVVPRLLAELVDHEDMHVRRVGIHACRRIGRFQLPGVREAVLRRLADENAWVRYDAAWTAHEAGYDGPDVRQLLSALASGVRLPEDEERLRANPSDSELAARVRARQALDALLAGSAPDAEPGAAADRGRM
jgi:hypothetical protein